MKGSAKEELPPPLTCSGGRDMALPSRRTLQLKVHSAAPSSPPPPSPAVAGVTWHCPAGALCS